MPQCRLRWLHHQAHRPEEVGWGNQSVGGKGTHVHRGLARPDVGTNDLFRVVEKSADRIVDAVCGYHGSASFL